jgi:hypothetical protein
LMELWNSDQVLASQVWSFAGPASQSRDKHDACQTAVAAKLAREQDFY